jgi:hypothetical protein
MIDPIVFHHSGSAGDVICSMATIKTICDRDQRKAKIILNINNYVQTQILKCWMPFKLATSLKPFLLSQPYVYTVEIHENYTGKIDYNLDEFRKTYWEKNVKNIVYAHLQTFGLNKEIGNIQYIVPHKIKKEKLAILSVTPRYRNGLNYLIECENLAKKYKISFVGYSKEYELFLKEYAEIQPFISFYPTTNHYKIYKLLCVSELFIGNGSSVACIAEGLKMNAIYEIDPQNPSLVFNRPNLILK